MSEKKSRAELFDAIMKGAKTTENTQTSEHSDVQTSESLSTSTPKSKDPDYQRTTVYLPKTLHKKLRAAAIAEDRQMSDVIEEIVSQWLQKKEGDKHSDV